MSWIYALQALSQALFVFFGGKIQQILGSKYTVMIGGLILSFSVIITYWTCNELWSISITYGFIHGIGVG